MMTVQYEQVAKTILERRTRKPILMNGEKIADEQILQLLELGNAAPTHGRTEPWRFQVFVDEGLERFCNFHAETYWQETNPDIRTEHKYNLFKSFHNHASHLVIVTMKRTQGTKIPDFEEFAAASAAVQNILLGAEALGIAAIWNTGGMTYSESMKKFLGLEEEDMMVGLLYLGHVKEGMSKDLTRRMSAEEKTQWYRS